MIIKEQAIVYRGGGRRWFSKSAAANAEARKLIKSRCYCSAPEEVQGRFISSGETCFLHQQERYKKALRRLARLVIASSAIIEDKP